MDADRIYEEISNRFKYDPACCGWTAEITFKGSGNVWKLEEYRTAGRGVGGHRYVSYYVKATCGDVEKYFKSEITLAKAIAAGYIK